MAVLTKSALAQLLANVAADLANDTAHPNLAGLYNQALDESGDAISPVFRLRPWEVPYAVVTPGEVLLRSGGGGRRGRHTVRVHLVHSVLSDEHGRDVTIGAAASDGVATLLEAIEEALAAETRANAPYTGSTYGASPYTSQTAVRAVWADRWTEPDELEVRAVEAPDDIAAIFVRQVLELTYHLEKGP